MSSARGGQSRASAKFVSDYKYLQRYQRHSVITIPLPYIGRWARSAAQPLHALAIPIPVMKR